MILIEKDKAIKKTWEDPSYSDPLNVLTEIRDRLNALPTIEIVKCGECKWYKAINFFGTEATVCKRMCCDVAEYEFCSRGERRSEDDTRGSS